MKQETESSFAKSKVTTFATQQNRTKYHDSLSILRYPSKGTAKCRAMDNEATELQALLPHFRLQHCSTSRLFQASVLPLGPSLGPYFVETCCTVHSTYIVVGFVALWAAIRLGKGVEES